MKRTIQFIIAALAVLNLSSLLNPERANALAPSTESGSARTASNVASEGGGRVGSKPSTSAASASRSTQNFRKPAKMRYGKLMRSKPADQNNFGLLKSYCSHSHGKRWSKLAI